MKTTSEYLIDIIEDMICNLNDGGYDDSNGPWEREMLCDIECHPEFKSVEGYLKTHESAICSMDILNLVKYVHRKMEDNTNGTS